MLQAAGHHLSIVSCRTEWRNWGRYDCVMDIPKGIAKFDSASAMTLALARCLGGQDFSGLGQPAGLQAVTRGADWVPRRLREFVFAHMGAQEGVKPDEVDTVSCEQIAEWVTQLYPKRHYPAVMIGSSNGALGHINAALGIPWLGQTFLTLVDQKGLDADDAIGAMEAGKEPAARFLDANPDVQLHQMHDPAQDRLMTGLISYFRWKFRRLPQAYREFIRSSVAPGGTVYIVECSRRWPTTRVGERHVYQFGALGGPTTEEYLHGGKRVKEYLKRHNSSYSHWKPPATDTDGPEAEWGFEESLREDILQFARREGYRVVRILFDDPEDTSGLVADFYRDWYHERGMPTDRLVIESFVLHEPHWVMRTGAVPLWMTFNMKPSLEFVEKYLDETAPFEQIYLMLFAHGVDSIGLPDIEEWRQLLNRAGNQGEFLGLKPETYPAHFAHFGRYSQALRDKIPERFDLPEPLPLARFEQFAKEHGAPRYGVRLEPATADQPRVAP